MVDPTLHAGVELAKTDLAPLPLIEMVRKPAAGFDHHTALHPAMPRVDHESEPGNAPVRGKNLGAFGMKGES
ncbi:MAG: hypothetical protein AB2601_21230 [Candidatus Thiodiazotropha sp.]|nr:hypothetical protein [Candidatus Thiodiazotropha sp. (ex Codakia orbicularis)]